MQCRNLTLHLVLELLQRSPFQAGVQLTEIRVHLPMVCYLWIRYFLICYQWCVQVLLNCLFLAGNADAPGPREKEYIEPWVGEPWLSLASLITLCRFFFPVLSLFQLFLLPPSHTPSLFVCNCLLSYVRCLFMYYRIITVIIPWVFLWGGHIQEIQVILRFIFKRKRIT